jgi:hypothetical protein
MELKVIDNKEPRGRRLPSWLKRPLPTGEVLLQTRSIVQRSGVATVCQEAKCPNPGGMLVPASRDVHDPGRAMHAAVPVLCCGHGEAAATGA